MDPGDVLVGTGGTVRNLAKIDKASRRYPLARLHAYELSARSVGEISRMLATRSLVQRVGVPGLNQDRVDSIAGGALGIKTLVEHLGATSMVVSGMGVREGLARVGSEGIGRRLPSARDVRTVSVKTLAQRFSADPVERGEMRSQLATGLLSEFPDEFDDDRLEAVRHAALLVDVGSAIDFYNRNLHTADVVLAGDLLGFDHHRLATLALLIRYIDSDNPPRADLRTLVWDEDLPWLAKAGVALALAEETVDRVAPGSEFSVGWTIEPRVARLSGSVPATWRPRALGRRFKRAFRLRLELPSGGLNGNDRNGGEGDE
jgi:exopolyphosphatase/guanosine-5'-triphosphate,3'-diphosphate pyrophosphatase